MRQRPLWPAALLLMACAPVDITAVGQDVRVGCEDPSAEALVPAATMLPGWRCGGCHVQGGQAGRIPWTAGGTVFPKVGSPCGAGAEGVKVELLSEADEVLLSFTTNRAGNFFTAEAIPKFPFRARVSKDGKSRTMARLVPVGDCGLCHYPGGDAGARIYLE